MKDEYLVPVHRGFVAPITDTGSLAVVNAARVSFSKHKDTLDDSDLRLLDYLARHNHWTPFAHVRFCAMISCAPHTAMQIANMPGVHIDPRDLITYREPAEMGDITDRNIMQFYCSLSLYHLAHLKVVSNLRSLDPYVIEPPEDCRDAYNALAANIPSSSLIEIYTFSTGNLPPTKARPGYAHATLHYRMPIFVARQWMRSNGGIVYNEESRRYVDHAPDYFYPEQYRLRPDKNIKQGSGIDASDKVNEHVQNTVGELTAAADNTYCSILALDIAPELARIVLPLSTYTEFWMTATLPALHRILSLRLDPHAQLEIREYAEATLSVLSSNPAWLDYLRINPLPAR